MARFSRTVEHVLSRPLLLGQELQRFLDDPKCEVPAASREGIASTIRTAVRHALRTGDSPAELGSRKAADSYDIRDLVPTLHVHARAAGLMKDHRAAGDAEGRAHRFVEWLTGGRRFDERFRVDWSCPEVMLPLVPHVTRVCAKSSLALLHRLSVLSGVQDVPRRWPSYESLVEKVLQVQAPRRRGTNDNRDEEAAARARIHDALSTYRTSRVRMLAAAPNDAERAALEDKYAIAPRAACGRAVHIGSHEEVREILRSEGYVPDGMSAFDSLRALNPALAEDLEMWRAGPGSEQSTSFQEQCALVLVRAGGWVVKAGYLAEFRALRGMDDLFAVQVETEQRVKLNPRQIREARRRGENPEQMTIARISLLEAGVEAVALDSLKRSSVAAEEVPLRADGKPYLIYGLYAVCVKLWTMASALYAKTAGQSPEDAQRWALASANWTRLITELKERALPAEYQANAKDKKKLIRLVTLPQLVCVAFPLRRRELRALRARWQRAVVDATEKKHNPAEHPAVRAAEKDYFSEVQRHLMLAMTLDDGLRRKQYQHGRLGFNQNFSPVFARGGGRPAGAIEGLSGVNTNWFGDINDSAGLKIRVRDDRPDSRTGRDVRPGLVDMDLLWDFISVWRPKLLVAAGRVPSLTMYDLEADMREGRWALFPSDAPVVVRPENSRTDVSELVGRELHYLVRTFLRRPVSGVPQVPEWDALEKTWKGLWAQHVTRLLNTSYHGGVRNDWKAAMYLTKDNEQTLRDEYNVVNEEIEEKLGLDVTNWEHPGAYDAWMDRLTKGRQVFDPLEDPALPLPDHVRAQLDQERVASRRLGAPAVRISKARPGQALPANAPNAVAAPKLANKAVPSASGSTRPSHVRRAR